MTKFHAALFKHMKEETAVNARARPKITGREYPTRTISHNFEPYMRAISGPGFLATEPYAKKTLKEKHCLWCGVAFTPLNSKGKFCKVSHRVAFFKFKKRHQKRVERKKKLEQLLTLPEPESIFDSILRQELETKKQWAQE